ncbi:DUF726-domain-containing protein [Cylindrobasidium torrendii FP15055 ss-10]|uniref:DUF726-domain-containing protein n=1 Tax=Cylindrobasidium torrendii FP15055 ss-10 TaxID=1314674 RepID=A0A0D7BPC4_9AGAR|nr:DUF726-domain-containing protein [Cylindrobasidium torrendii FP15055 ss-10]
MSNAGILQITPPKELNQDDRDNVFEHIYRRLAAHRNTALLLADVESTLSSHPDSVKQKRRDEVEHALNNWAQSLLQQAYTACAQPEKEKCPMLDPFTDTSTRELAPLPAKDQLTRILNAILFLDVTSTKQFSSQTRVFLRSIGHVDEDVIVFALKHPEEAIEQAQKQADETTKKHASKGKALRMVGVGLSAVAGGVLVGVTGGLAAPLVGAAVGSVLGVFGIGGTVVGVLAAGLAGSSVVCGALFGAYGAKRTSEMIGRHTQEIRDLALLPVWQQTDEGTLSVRLCISGWLRDDTDVTEPWDVFEEADTFALRWEVETLKELSDALYTLVTDQTMTMIKVQVIKRTMFASLMAALAPTAWIKIGRIIDNPWSNAIARANKAGRVLGDLLANRVFGTRPVTLTGYSLGALVILEALKYLAALPPKDTIGLIEDVFLFGTPASTDERTWSSVRRLVAGRLVNGYASNDYVLNVLSRVSNWSWNVAGLERVNVKDVENVQCDFVDGHTRWRGMIGRALMAVGSPGINPDKVDSQMREVDERDNGEIELNSGKEAQGKHMDFTSNNTAPLR